MGKPTGFMEYDREVKQRRLNRKERIKNFDEFHIHLSKEKHRRVRQRAAWHCGVPVLSVGYDTHGHDQRLPAAQSGAGVE